MKDWLRHLPFMLVLFIVLYVAFVDLSIRADSHVLVTLLAPILWLGLYLLGSDHAASER